MSVLFRMWINGVGGLQIFSAFYNFLYIQNVSYIVSPICFTDKSPESSPDSFAFRCHMLGIIREEDILPVASTFSETPLQ